MISLKHAALGAALAIMLTGGAARADSDDHWSPMMGHGGHHGMGKSFEHVEGHIAFLKAELKIDDAQSVKWNAFAEALRSNAKDMKAARAGMKDSDDDAALPELVARYEKMMTFRLDQMRKVSAAIMPLYAALNDDQKHTADKLMNEMCAM